MILQPYTFNATSLNSTDYATEFPRAGAELQMVANSSYVRRAGAPPVFAGKDFQPKTLTLEVICLGSFMAQFESLNQLFDTKDETPRQFVCIDTEDSNRQYYVYATAERVLGGHDGNMATVTLAVDNPIWLTVTQNSQTFSTTSSTSSTDVTNAGNDYAHPIFEITPSSVPANGYLYNMFVQALPTSTDPWNRRFLDITGATDTTWDTAALIAGGKMQASSDPGGAGGDIRVYQDGVEVNYWLDGINTTDTHVIVVADMPAAQNMTLKTAIASTDTITEVVLNNTTANRRAINAMPNNGRLILDSALGSTDTEEYTYTSRTITDSKLAFTINARSVRNTSAFSFAAGSNVRYLPYDFNIIYGNTTATAPTIDDTNKPIQSLTSRNSSFVYAAFYDVAGLRANIWNPYLRRVTNTSLSRSVFYTSTNDEGDTDPATAMGIGVYTYEDGGIWKSETATLGWLGYFPDRVASVANVTGTQQQTGSDSMTFALQSSFDGETFTNLWTVSAQASSDYSTWTAWTKASSDATPPANTRYLRFRGNGTIGGAIDKSDRRDITAVTVGLTNYPHVMIRTEASNHKLDATITNETTGESFDIVYPMPVSDTLYIDCDPDFPTVKHRGQIVNGAIKLSTIRSAWLKLNPGSNTISYQTNNTGASDISIVIKWRTPMNFF